MFIKTKIKEDEYQHINDIVKNVWTSKYFLGIRISHDCETTRTPIPPITEMVRKTATMGEVTIKTGMRVIVRGNEPDPLMICKITGFTNLGGKIGDGSSNAFPVIEDEADGKEYFSMGIVVPYSDELLEELKDLQPIEQWNYLTFSHGQIKEKYGIKYKTFR